MTDIHTDDPVGIYKIYSKKHSHLITDATVPLAHIFEKYTKSGLVN